MDYIFPILYIIFYTMTLVVLTKKSFGKCLPLTFFLSSFIMLFGIILFNTFSVGFYLNIIFSILGIIILLVKIKLKKNTFKEFKTKFVTKGLIAFLVISVLILVYDFNRSFSCWDEFSHWGVMIKEMWRLDSLYTVSESTLMVHKDYPPIIQLYELLFIKLAGGFSEERLINSIHLLELALFIPAICEKITKKDKKIQKYFSSISLFFSVIFLILFLDCHAVMNSIYTDYLLAILVAYILFSIINEKDNLSNFAIFNISISSSFLLLTKQMGLPLYMMCLFLYFSDIIMKKIIKKDKRKNIKKIIVVFISVIIIPISIWKCWDIYVNNAGVARQFELSSIHLSELYGIATSTGGEVWQQTAFQNFIKGLTNISLTTSFIKLNYYQLVALGLLLVCLIYFYAKKYFYNKQIYSIMATLIIGAAGYAFTMLLLYVFSFGSYEGPALASFNRYMPTYVMIIFALALMLFIFYTNKKKDYKLVYILVVILLIIQSPDVLQRITFPNQKLSANIYELNANCIKKEAEDDSKVFIIAQNSSGNYQYYIKYYLDSMTTNLQYYSLDVNTESSEEYFYNNVYQYMKDYDYLYLANIDDSFKEEYSFLFDKTNIENHQLYKIKKANNKLKFQLIEWCEI